ncbi:MAG: TetR/AcrR family transcriptional regulator [Caulobacterales bacterium]
MRETGNVLNRKYHHGDLSRALVDAARRILEAEGPAALSLRAVAREAGVSPAAPYHHFKDKCELVDAVSHQGWEALGETIAKARARARTPQLATIDIGVAYVKFALHNPALYRLMYDGIRDREAMPAHAKEADSGYRQVEEAIIEAGVDGSDPVAVQLATVAVWCAAHGVAEMAGMKQFDPLKEALGGEDAFIRALLEHVGVHRHHGHRAALTTA